MRQFVRKASRRITPPKQSIASTETASNSTEGATVKREKISLTGRTRYRRRRGAECAAAQNGAARSMVGTANASDDVVVDTNIGVADVHILDPL